MKHYIVTYRLEPREFTVDIYVNSPSEIPEKHYGMCYECGGNDANFISFIDTGKEYILPQEDPDNSLYKIKQLKDSGLTLKEAMEEARRQGIIK